MSITTQKPRIIAIDIMKVFAVLLVINSHLDICYQPPFGMLATGGAFGDALFFFCSGFMLFRGADLRFDNFMKRRISRIYPTVFMVAIIGALVFGNTDNIIDIILHGGGWFVNCIMIYYVALWCVKRWFLRSMWIVWCTVAVIVLVWYYAFYDHGGHVSIYKETYIEWAFFFIYMLQGAIMGLNPDRYPYNKWVIPKLLTCMAIWYSFQLFERQVPLFVELQYLTLIPLYGVTYYFYKLCCAPFWHRLYNHRIIGQILFITGGLCLEAYLIQFYLLTDRFNWMFPFNIPMITLIILLIAYIVNFLSSALAQTFRREDYNWRQCFLHK